MSRRIFTTAIVLYFAILFCGPLFLWLSGVRNSSIENTALNEPPAFDLQQFYSGEYSKKLSRYIVEQNPIRPVAIKTNGWLNYHFFRDGQQGQVLQGKDGWLFYQPSIVRGCPPKERGLKIEAYLQQFVSLLAGNKQKVLLSVAPNKHAIYPEFSSQRMRLIEKCAIQSRREIRAVMSRLPPENYIDVYDVLLSHKDNYPSEALYSNLNTHWSNYAAALYGQIVLKQSNVQHKLASKPVILEKYLYKKPDLSKMLGLNNMVRYHQYGLKADAAITPPINTPIVRLEIPAAKKADLHFSENMVRESDKARDNGPERVIVIHDSFMYWIWQSLSNNFRQVLYVHWNALQHLDMTKLLLAADLIVIEAVERHAAQQFGKKMPNFAPLQELDQAIAESDPALNEQAWREALSYPRKTSKLF